MNTVFVFNGSNAKFPSGIFTEYETAKKWIAKHLLSGILTQYPINAGVYDWAIENEYFEAKSDYQTKAEFIQRFTSASMQHYHFENGIPVNE